MGPWRAVRPLSDAGRDSYITVTLISHSVNTDSPLTQQPKIQLYDMPPWRLSVGRSSNPQGQQRHTIKRLHGSLRLDNGGRPSVTDATDTWVSVCWITASYPSDLRIGLSECVARGCYCSLQLHLGYWNQLSRRILRCDLSQTSKDWISKHG